MFILEMLVMLPVRRTWSRPIMTAGGTVDTSPIRVGIESRELDMLTICEFDALPACDSDARESYAVVCLGSAAVGVTDRLKAR